MPTAPKYTIGLDYGTNSVRALVVDIRNGREIGVSVWNYAHGHDGVILKPSDPHLARQHPADYLKGAESVIKRALSAARKNVRGFSADQVVGLGVDTTGSTPIPVDESGIPLAFQKRFAANPAAMAWLWKDHTSVAAAADITALAMKMRPAYLAACGGVYSSEWFWSKILNCLRSSPSVFRAAHSWIELADFVPAALTGTNDPSRFVAGVCAAGHKAMWNPAWGGYPDAEFLARLHPGLATLRTRLTPRVWTAGQSVGGLTHSWARKTGLRTGIPVSVGAFDAHLGAIGAGIAPGVLVKTIGTSTCDIVVQPRKRRFAAIPGLCGIVDGSVVPGLLGLEAGQSAVGDLFTWFVDCIKPGGGRAASHEFLAAEASHLRAGESGLLALDWNNGNRTVLVDQRLTGLLVGQTLYTRPAEIYRALIEATAFGALTIIRQMEAHGVKISSVVNCGGIAEKNPLVMQIYADVTGRPMRISRSAQTCALGAAIAAAVAAGAHKDFRSAQSFMSGLKSQSYTPNARSHSVYRRLYPLYRQLHDAFGTPGWSGNLHGVMKELLEIRAAVSKQR